MSARTRVSILLSICIILSGVVYMGCSKSPLTGRNSLSLVDDATIMSLSNDQYKSFLAANPPITGTADAALVNKVGSRLATAVSKYLAQIGQSDLIKDYQWEFNLVNSSEVNAWCLPGGKIVVYTGILPYTQDEGGLAVVLAHEISHAVLKHGKERMSEQLVIQYGGVALSYLLSSKPAETQQLFNTVYNVSSNLGILAYSRKHEYEADEYGLYFMAMATYDPNIAVSFWKRMAAVGGTKPPEIISTHPSDANRIDHINQLLPKALSYYHP